ncbi:MAG: hypothetical protein GF308_08890 [Candidatus Heimdallarchaeota archaeon]|nr:hypothetical protein [Candidatus Heimdallarchaeota archaeon]
MIDEFFVLKSDGICLFHMPLTDKQIRHFSSDLFAGFTSAIVTFASQLGRSTLTKIELQDKIFVFEKTGDLISVARISSQEDFAIAKHVVSLLHKEFIEDYSKNPNLTQGIIKRDVYKDFEETVREITQKCEQIAHKTPELLRDMPVNIRLDNLEEISNFSEQLVDQFPEATIRLVRVFQPKLPKEIMHVAMKKLGGIVGKKLARNRFKSSIIDEKEMMKLLKEISVCSLQDDVRITLKICPFCRGRKAEEPYCDFVSGFIEGALGNPAITVKEISCHAIGDKYCQFDIIKEK